MPDALRYGMRPIPITITTDEIDMDVGNVIDAIGAGKTTSTKRHVLRVPTWPKADYTKQQLLDMVLEACPNPRRLYYVDLGATHGACAIH